MRARTVVFGFIAVALLAFLIGALLRVRVLATGMDHRYELVSAGGALSVCLLGISFATIAVILTAAVTLTFLMVRAVLRRMRTKVVLDVEQVPGPTERQRMSATRAATLLSVVILVLASPIIGLVALQLYVDAPRYRVESSSMSPDGRFRLDNEGASTFDRSYRRIRLVRVGDESDDRFFCEAAGGDLVGTFVDDNAFVVTFPDYVGKEPNLGVFSERVQFDPADLRRADVTLLGGANTC